MAKKWVEARKTVAVDFNGVLDTYVGYRGSGFMYPPRVGTFHFLYTLKELGYKVVIMSSADPGLIQEWLKEYHMDHLVDQVTDQKVPAIVYLDDRAVTFTGDFDKALYDIVNFKTHWENGEQQELK